MENINLTINNSIKEFIESNFKDLKYNTTTKCFVNKDGVNSSIDNLARDISSMMIEAKPDDKNYYKPTRIRDFLKSYKENHSFTPETPKSDDDNDNTSETELPEWASGVIKTKKGGVKDCTDNIKIFINNNPKYKGAIKFNQFKHQLEIGGEPITDALRSTICNDIETTFGFFSPAKVNSVLNELENTSSYCYHPLKDYFKDLVWDGKDRLSTVLIDWFQADDTPLIREFGRLWFIGAVKRALQPGCKFDYLLMLVGAQGIGKTTFCERLAMNLGYVDGVPVDQPKEYIPLLNSNWIINMDERGSLSKKDQNLIKNFLTKTEDSIRLSYRRDPETFKRHCVFIGSTNDERFLNDYSCSEERRYWVVKCNSTSGDNIFKNFTQEVVDQLWAEAYRKYCENPDIDLVLSKDVYEEFKEYQSQFKTVDEDAALMLLNEKLNSHWDRDKFESSDEFIDIMTHPEVYSNGDKIIDNVPVNFLNMYLNKLSIKKSPNQMKLIMEKLGFKKVLKYYAGTKSTQLCWYRDNSLEIDDIPADDTAADEKQSTPFKKLDVEPLL